MAPPIGEVNDFMKDSHVVHPSLNKGSLNQSGDYNNKKAGKDNLNRTHDLSDVEEEDSMAPNPFMKGSNVLQAGAPPPDCYLNWHMLPKSEVKIVSL
jgi:hypothetical protein